MSVASGHHPGNDGHGSLPVELGLVPVLVLAPVPVP